MIVWVWTVASQILVASQFTVCVYGQNLPYPAAASLHCRYCADSVFTAYVFNIKGSSLFLQSEKRRSVFTAFLFFICVPYLNGCVVSKVSESHVHSRICLSLRFFAFVVSLTNRQKKFFQKYFPTL